MIDRLIAFPDGQPRLQPRADRIRARRAGAARRPLATDLRRLEEEGESLCDVVVRTGPSENRWTRAVRPHRHGAGRWPGLDERPVRGHASRRPHPRSRHGRHEGLHRDRARLGAAFPGGAGSLAGAPVADLRRGDHLSRRARPGGGSGRARHPAGGLPDRRADRHAGDRGAQGQARFLLPGARARIAFGADAGGGQCDRVRGAPDRLHPQPGRSPVAR